MRACADVRTFSFCDVRTAFQLGSTTFCDVGCWFRLRLSVEFIIYLVIFFIKKSVNSIFSYILSAKRMSSGDYMLYVQLFYVFQLRRAVCRHVGMLTMHS